MIGFVEFLATTFLKIFSMLCNAYLVIVVVACFITWVNPDPYNPIVRFLRTVTEPVFYRVRKWLPFTMVGGFDLSPLVVLIAIEVLSSTVYYIVGSIMLATAR